MPEKGSLHDIISNGYQLLVLPIKPLNLSKYDLTRIELYAFGTARSMIERNVGIILHFIEYDHDSD